MNHRQSATADHRLATRAGGLILPTIGLAIVLLFAGIAAGCETGQQPGVARTRGVEVRDPAGRWHTYLPPGYILDHREPPHEVSIHYLSFLPTRAARFGIVPDASIQSDGPPPITVTVFGTPNGTPAEWYAPLLTQLRTGSYHEQLGSIPVLTFVDIGGMAPTTFYVGAKEHLGFEFEIFGEQARSILEVLTYVVDHLEPLP